MNRQYTGNNFNDIYTNVLRDLTSFPDYFTKNKNGECLQELVNPTLVLTQPDACIALSRNISKKYLKGEIEFYLSGSPYLKDIAKHSKFWEKVSDDGETINSNYGRLLFHDRNSHNLTQFEYASSCLKNNTDSKKAVMVIYNKDHARKSKDNPCTMYLQFILRNGDLHLFVKMRSSDVWYGLPYDVPFFALVQFRMCVELNVKMGTYVHNSGSLHMYDRNKTEIVIAATSPYKSRIKEQQEIFNDLIKQIW